MTEDAAKFEAFINYDFEHDEKFQSGLSSIVKKSSGEPDKETIDRAKWFYYTKFIENLDLEKFEAWQKSQKEEENKANEEEPSKKQETRTPKFSFQELVEMIEKGVEIPGIRQIPNKINEGTPSEPKLPVRQKPWEARK